MSLFKELEGEVAIIASGGVYKQVPLYELDGYLFAMAGGGFIRIQANGSTSKPKTRVVRLVTDKDLYKSEVGYLTVTKISGAKALKDESRQKLINANGGL